MAPIGRCTPEAAAVVEVLGITTAASVAGVMGGGTVWTVGVVATGAVHCIGAAVAGLEMTLGITGVEGDATSGVVEGCGETAPARGLRPRLAAMVPAPRPRPLGVAEAPGLEGLAGMKARSWVNGEAMVVEGGKGTGLPK
jgi:hypothetical protein